MAPSQVRMQSGKRVPIDAPLLPQPVARVRAQNSDRVLHGNRAGRARAGEPTGKQGFTFHGQSRERSLLAIV